jgi:hypothetical protein
MKWTRLIVEQDVEQDVSLEAIEDVMCLEDFYLKPRGLTAGGVIGPRMEDVRCVNAFLYSILVHIRLFIYTPSSMCAFIQMRLRPSSPQ